MPSEIEVKLAVPSLEEPRTELTRQKARRIGRVLEPNYIFDRFETADGPRLGVGRLRQAGAALRVRSVEVLEGELLSATITFKGPVESSRFKKREELELPLTDADGMRRLLVAVGFIEVLRFRKRRESWSFQDCRVELDELPRLGCFVEIEGPDEDSIQAVREALGLTESEPVRQSYVALVAEAYANQVAAGALIDFDSA